MSRGSKLRRQAMQGDVTARVYQPRPETPSKRKLGWSSSLRPDLAVLVEEMLNVRELAHSADLEHAE